MRSDISSAKALEKLRDKAPLNGAFLVTSASDIRYFLRFYSSGVILLVPRKGRPVCFIDVMNRSLAKDRLKGSGVEVVSGNFPVPDMMTERVMEMGIRELFLDEGNVSAAFYGRVKKRLKGIGLRSVLCSRPVRDILMSMRAVKSAGEISLLRFAAGETVKIWRKVSGRIKPGMTEIEIARMVDVLVRRSGYENAFPTIAAAGINSAYPHAIPTDKKLGRKEHLVVDFGIRHKFYCSDLTRIWGECRMNGQIRDLCENVREVQKKAIGYIGPGVSIKQTVRKVNELFVERGLGKFVMHGLGHGIGLDVHEGPFLGTGSRDNFEKGMVLTVEPGLYIEGKGGARIEDMVLVTSKGREVLTVW
jgi:Xaa-Pro aminopeptidase